MSGGGEDPLSAPGLRPGQPVTVVKLRFDGTEATRYSGVARPAHPGWVVVEASWERDRLDLGYLVFDPGDIFLEYFALAEPLNAFAILGEGGMLKGWYGNVTYPTKVQDATVYWHDLYVDVIVYPDRRTLVLDEDELHEAGLVARQPELHRLILYGRDRLLQLARAAQYPFSETPPR